MDESQIRNGFVPANGGDAALIPIAEWPAWLVLHAAADLFRDILPHLDGDWSYSGNRRAILLEVRHVADGKDLRMSFDIQSVIDDDATTAIDFSAHCLA